MQKQRERGSTRVVHACADPSMHPYNTPKLTRSCAHMPHPQQAWASKKSRQVNHIESERELERERELVLY